MINDKYYNSINIKIQEIIQEPVAIHLMVYI